LSIGGSILLIAVGAILKFAVNVSVSGVNLQTVGVILMIVGVLGLVLSLIFLAPWRRHPTYPEDPTIRRNRDIY
jgi:hypothetical protein